MNTDNPPMIRPVFLRGLFTVAAGISFLLFLGYFFLWCFSRVNPYVGSLEHGEYTEIVAPGVWVDGWRGDEPPLYIFVSLGFTCCMFAILPTVWWCWVSERR